MKSPHKLFILGLALTSILTPLSGSTAIANTVIDITKTLAENQISPDGVYWNFDGNADDASGNGYHGVLDGGGSGLLPTFAPGKFGSAVRLQGASSNVRDPNVRWPGSGAAVNTNLDFVGTSFTGGAWLKFDTISPNVAQTVYVLERGASVDSGVNKNFFSFQLKKDNQDNWTLLFSLSNPSAGVAKLSSTLMTSAFNDLDWHHVGFSLDYNPDGENAVYFYLDGEQFGEAVLTSINLAPTGNAGHRQFGVGERGVATYNGNFNGLIDEAFVTSGRYTFASIPEPNVALLGGVAVLFALSVTRFKLV